MTKLARLRKEAMEAVNYRDHKMPYQWTKHDFFSNIQYKTCISCGCQVSTNIRPAPNEIDIGGDALALGCQDEQRVFTTSGDRLR